MSLDIELYTIEETPLDGFIPRIRAIADELFALRYESCDADSSYEKLANVADELERRKKIVHWERNFPWGEKWWQHCKCRELVIRPDENGIDKAAQMIPHLTEAVSHIAALGDKADADQMRMLGFMIDYLGACRQSPDAYIHASR
jgi:hypothetical protein